MNWIQANATSLNADVPSSGYYSYGSDQNWTSQAFWQICTACTFSDAANNQISWSVSRVCRLTGSPSGAGNFCQSSSTTTSGGGSYSSDAVNFTGSSLIVLAQARNSLRPSGVSSYTLRSGVESCGTSWARTHPSSSSRVRLV